MMTFRQRLAPQIKFLQNRLSPRGYLGLHLTLGMLAIILGCWWFGGIVEDLLTNDPLVQIATILHFGFIGTERRR